MVMHNFQLAPLPVLAARLELLALDCEPYADCFLTELLLFPKTYRKSRLIADEKSASIRLDSYWESVSLFECKPPLPSENLLCFFLWLRALSSARYLYFFSNSPLPHKIQQDIEFSHLFSWAWNTHWKIQKNVELAYFLSLIDEKKNRKCSVLMKLLCNSSI